MSDYKGEHEGPDSQNDVLLSNRVYDWLKRASLYVLPALAAAYFGLAQIWGLPNAEEVVGTVAVIETFLGAVLRISNTQYQKSGAKFDGKIDVAPDYENGLTDLNVSIKPESVAFKDEILVKINRPQ